VQENYQNTELVFLDIANIHVMRERCVFFVNCSQSQVTYWSVDEGFLYEKTTLWVVVAAVFRFVNGPCHFRDT